MLRRLDLSKVNNDIQESIDRQKEDVIQSEINNENNDGVAPYSFRGLSNCDNEDSILEKIELRAREYLKTLPYETLVYSGLWYFKFDTVPLYEILFSIWFLAKEINSLDTLIKKYDGCQIKVYRLGPKPTLPNAVYTDYNHKNWALRDILANEDVRYLYDDYVNNRLAKVTDSKSKSSR